MSTTSFRDRKSTVCAARVVLAMLAGCSSYDAGLLHQRSDAGPDERDGGSVLVGNAGRGAAGVGGSAGSHGDSGAAGTGGSAGSGAVGCHPNPDINNEVCSVVCPEQCNGLDDDCDRQIDEGEASDNCKLAHATATCDRAAHECVVMGCSVGFHDCDGSSVNGCESEWNEPNNCGSCGHSCGVLNAIAGCSKHKCVVLGCDKGFLDCDSEPLTCETPSNTLTDCGGCDVQCKTVANASPSCASGTCGVDKCNAGYGDCDHDGSNGCEQVLNTLDHCGACDTPCQLSGTQATCDNSAQVCTSTGCDLGWGDCDGDAQNGCESLATAINCKQCGKACSVSALQHVTSASCGSSSGCVIACAPGWGDCDGDAQTGCEARLDTITHCGTCAACPTPQNGLPSCVSGVCGLAGCNQGFGHCSGGAANGCETSLDTLQNCGSCGVACNKAACGGGNCSAIDCSSMPGLADCNGDGVTCETNLGTDLNNCGACNNVCQFDGSVTPHGTKVCNSQRCGVSCNAGFGDCDGNYKNGCETALNTLVNCGGCGQGCAIANASATCATGSCKVATCNADYADCDGDQKSCETALDTPAHCGACGTQCSLPNAIASCGGSGGARVCTVSGCTQTYYKNCDGVAGNGCEVDSRTDVANCGTCGSNCSALPAVMTATCSGGACGISACQPGYGNCTVAPGCETPVNTVQNCGSCGNACAMLANTQTTSCDAASSSCKVGSCKTGFGNCDLLDSTGCETTLTGNIDHCNACNVACALNMGVTGHGSLSCDVAGCGMACATGFGDCDHDYKTGCETDLASNTANCNACGNVCAFNSGVHPYGTLSCTPQGCGIACDAYHDDCDGDYKNGCERNTAATGPCGTSNPCTGVTCSALDQCHNSGVCDPLMGVCSNPTKANGAACSDGDMCTQTDTCQAGACISGAAVTCPNADPQCHTTGACNPTTGVCANTGQKANNTACNDGNAGTVNDACSNGTCRGTAPCTVDSNCGNSEYCATGSGSCLAKGSSAAACTAPNQCMTGACTSSACGSCLYAGWSTSNIGISSACTDTTASTCINSSNLASAPAATLGCNQTIDTSTLSAASSTLGVCGTNLPYGVRTQSTSGGPSVVVFWLKSLTVSSGFSLSLIGNKPVVFIVDGAVSIAGQLGASSTTNSVAGAGAPGVSCAAGAGAFLSTNAGSSGGGGGGFQTAGAQGGLGDYGQGTRGGAGAVVATSTSLVPLRGGCSGGSGGIGHQKDASSPTSAAGAGGYGGGAIQISASGTITITGAINAGGGGGGFAAIPANSNAWSGGGGGGGGSGGAVLLEGASVTGNANVFANGGGGGGGGAGKKGTGSVVSCVTVGTAGSTGSANTTLAAGGHGAATANTSSCVSNATTPCLNAGAGGNGYTTTSAVSAGQDGEHWEGGAGGGGGGGRIVIGAAHAANTVAPICDDAKASTADTCSPGFIGCLHGTPVADGTSCKDDGNPCSIDAYSAGACVHTTAAPSSTLCGKSGDACISDVKCSGSSTTCPAASTGYKSSGSSCSDANANTSPDACNASGVCASTLNLCVGVPCAALDQCHNAGTCAPSTALCSNPNKADGTACDDANGVTSNDVCVNGVCTGG